jgi:hypothetical protein
LHCSRVVNLFIVSRSCSESLFNASASLTHNANASWRGKWVLESPSKSPPGFNIFQHSTDVNKVPAHVSSPDETTLIQVHVLYLTLSQPAAV